ncbi:MAG: hypothetical protein RL095_81 [Verrucomicrobiota bacterium]|jgi:aquaporin Z
MPKLFSEFLGTLLLIFAGCGAIVVNQQSGALGHVGVAISWGLAVCVLIEIFGNSSGAHFNPAVTLAFAVDRRFPWSQVPGYLLAQFAGAVSGATLLRLLFPSADSLGESLPSGIWQQSFLLEFMLSLLLMLAILAICRDGREKGLAASLCIGAAVGLDAMFAGPVCGASMNPARSFGPALISGHLQGLWIYLAAPVLGMLIAIPVHRLINAK